MAVALVPMLIMAAMTAVTSFVSAGMASKAANDQAAAAAESAQLAIDEQTRQQREQNRVSDEEKGDRARQADAELATMQVISGERGGLQTNTYARQTFELGYVEGADLSRIEANRKARIDAMQASKVAARQGAVNSIIEAKNTKTAAYVGAGLKTLSSAVQIGAGAYQQASYLDMLRNKGAQG